jgi:excisionase family DNA binding protein
MGEEERKVVTTTEAMKLLGLSRATVSRLLKRGDLEGYKLTPAKHSDLRIYVDSIEELKERRKVRVQ